MVAYRGFTCLGGFSLLNIEDHSARYDFLYGIFVFYFNSIKGAFESLLFCLLEKKV